jgi:histidinol-phosphate aminotransferase
MEGATAIYNFLKEQGIIVRNRSNVLLCEDSLRITVGTPQQNEQLLVALRKFK